MRHASAGALPAALLAVLGIVWIVCTVDPVDRNTWMLENVLLVLFVGPLAAGWLAGRRGSPERVEEGP